MITCVQAVDLDADGLLDVVVCDAGRDCISWIRQSPRGVFTERVIASDIKAPAHVQAIDFCKTGRLDLLVASMGVVAPNNDLIGSVIVLEHAGDGSFTRHDVATNIARVTDVRGGDFDGDGLMDLAVIQFGYTSGETRWMKNLGDWKFESHILQRLAGGIHCPVADLNGDGKPDIATLVSQEYEEIYGFINDGHGAFSPRSIYGSSNSDFGSSALDVADLNGDGRPDLLYTNGDSMDFIPPRPRPWHGVQWLENKGDAKFEFHRIADLPGAYNAKAIIMRKGHPPDVIAVSLFNRWEDPKAVSVVRLVNDGRMHFTMQPIATSPTHLVGLDVGDFKGDGTPSFVTGGLHMFPPFDRVSRVVLWTYSESPAGAAGPTRGAPAR